MDDWGWNPASFEAIGTVAAAVFAVVALMITRKQGRDEARRELSRLDAETKRNARMIWVRLRPPRPPSKTFELQLTNRSPEPIYCPQAVITTHHRSRKPVIDLLEEPEYAGATVRGGSLIQEWMGWETTSWHISPTWLPEQIDPRETVVRTIRFTEEPEHQIRILLTFTDSIRVQWEVSSDGSVSLMQEDRQL